MSRESMYGESLRKLKEIRDELEQRQVDMDILEDELETQYACLLYTSDAADDAMNV